MHGEAFGTQPATRHRVRWITAIAAVLTLLAVAPVGASGTSATAQWCELPAKGAPPVGVGPCPGVRPGAYLDIDHDTGCTMNFLFVGYRPDAQGNRAQEG